MPIKILTASLSGIDGMLNNVEVDISNGLPCFNIVGLGDMAVKESKERVRSAIINSGYCFPVKRITVNLAPADMKKSGSQFDLPIAIGILLASKQIECNVKNNILVLGELSLFGKLSSINGTLPIAIEALKRNFKDIILPYNNADECSILKGLNIYAFNSLNEVIDFLLTGNSKPYHSPKINKSIPKQNIDYKDIVGQESAKRAFEISASGWHNLIVFGPPGSGKTMLAKRLPSILPELNYKEGLEVAKIYSAIGKLPRNPSFMKLRPFRSPNHSSTKVSIIGGGVKLNPGEISLAHNGILFLDELLEFNKNVLNLLREPLEEKSIRISRTSGSVTFPANFLLIAALNPCPCGYYGSSRECTCSNIERKRYISKLSGALLDRIDIFTYAGEIPNELVSKTNYAESSSEIRSRVKETIKVQSKRFKNEGITYNSQMDESLIKKYCLLDVKACELMNKIYGMYSLSMRGYMKILKVARTIADMEGRKYLETSDIFEASGYRKFISEKII